MFWSLMNDFVTSVGSPPLSTLASVFSPSSSLSCLPACYSYSSFLSPATSPSSLSQRLTSAHLSLAQSPLDPPTHPLSPFLYSSLNPPPQSLCLPSHSLSFLAGQSPCRSSSISALFFSCTLSFLSFYLLHIHLHLFLHSSFLSLFLSPHVWEIFCSLFMLLMYC